MPNGMLGMMHGGSGGGGEWMAFWSVLSLVLLAALVVGAIYLIRALWPQSPPSGAGAAGDRDAAVEALRERFARGEIDRDEFERRRQTLSR